AASQRPTGSQARQGVCGGRPAPPSERRGGGGTPALTCRCRLIRRARPGVAARDPGMTQRVSTVKRTRVVRAILRRYTRMIRGTLLALALLAAPAIVVAQQPSPMQGQTPAADTSKGRAAASAH